MKYEIPCSVGLGYFVLSLDRSSDSGTTREEIESKVFVGMLPLVPSFIESKTINNASAFCNLVFCEYEDLLSISQNEEYEGCRLQA